MPSRTILSTSCIRFIAPAGFFQPHLILWWPTSPLSLIPTKERLSKCSAAKPRSARRRGAAETAGAVDADGEVDDGIFAIKNRA
jgi:hypothetical protein